MPETARPKTTTTREKLIALLNDDLEREDQAIIAYVTYSQVLKGAQYMNIAGELEVHAREELAHAPQDQLLGRPDGWHGCGQVEERQDLRESGRYASISKMKGDDS